MAELDPNASFETFKDRVLEGISKQFPIEGRDRSLVLEGLEVRDNLHPDDIRAQHEAKVTGNTWAVPVYAKLALKGKDGNVIDSRTVRVAELPKMTKRYSYIVGGQEYQMDHQWQLKPGAYTRRRQSGELETRFQVGNNKPSFDITFDTESKEFRMQYGGRSKSKIPLYPLMQAMGVDDAQLERMWGKQILESNKNIRNSQNAVAAFYKATRRTAPESPTDAHRNLVDTLKASTLTPDATALTLGKPFEHVTGEALALATKKILAVQAGQREDDRDSVVFKKLRGVGDYAYDKLMGASYLIRNKGLRKINTATNVRDVVKFDAINTPILEAFKKNQAAQFAKQINPVEMVSSAQQTTVMGEGGIKDERTILDEVKNLNASHMGFLDPVSTPEGSRTGVTLRLPMGVKVEGHTPKIPLYSLKTNKIEHVDPATFLTSKVVLPDQVTWKGGAPVPNRPTVRVSGINNDVGEERFRDADYVMRHSSQVFNPTTNLIPFLGNNSGGRATMATRHIEQAISLVDRDAPLVQVATPSSREGSNTFEALLGRHAVAHSSPIDGKVKSVKRDAIVVEGKDGKTHEVQLYNNYPLNDSKSVLDSTPVVKVGDKVHAGQIVADTNFSKGGELALGKNLKIAYIPYRGLNYEDAYVISETAAKKLSSLHLNKPSIPISDETVLGKSFYTSQRQGAFSKEQLSKIGTDGLVEVGARVNPGDPLVLALQKTPVMRRTGLAAIRKSLGTQHADHALTWEGEAAGEVVGVHRQDNKVVVHVKTIEPLQIGDKISNRHAAKGVVGTILPDREMPHTSDGTPMEVLMNPLGVGGRVNPGQLMETAASKVARKTGKPYVVENFSPGDTLEKVKHDLKAHGLSDTEELHDPVTGLSLGKVLTGEMHIMKLHHQVDKKIAVRSGITLPGHAPEKYNINLQPSGGGEEGGQSMDTLGHYALLAHGARANIREMQTFKSEGPDVGQDPNKRWASQHHDVWDAIQHGDPIPAPKPTFAFHKFTSMLKGAGINVEKRGNEIVLMPLTDKDIKSMTGDRVLPHPTRHLHTKIDPKTGEPAPIRGGLFDPQLTGGHGGQKWTRIEMAEPLPNPVFEKSIQALVGLSGKDYHAVVGGEKAVDHNGKLVEIGKGVTGGKAIAELLRHVDVSKELKRTRQLLDTTPLAKVNPLVKKVRRLEMLEREGLKPVDAYVLHSIPVLPPSMRPISLLKDGNLRVTDVNHLYASFAEVNEQLKDPVLQKGLTEEARKDLRRNLYDGAAALMGVGLPYKDAEFKGLLHQITGSAPKTSFFQNSLIKRKQDLSMRGVVIPDPSLGLDEVGLPKEHALKLLAPFVVKNLHSSGVAPNVVEAQKMVAAGTPQALRALEEVARDRPVLIKRDPVLHKYSIQAFKPRLVEGHTIKVHPLITTGFGMDFDGDSTSVFVPVTEEAKREAYQMMPSRNLFSEATGRLMYQPTLESALGLYKLSRVDGEAKPKTFKDFGAAVEASRSGKLDVTHPISVDGQKTTVGRVIMAAALPQALQGKVLSDLSLRLDKGGLEKLLTEVAKKHQGDFGTVVNKLKNLGNGASFGVVTVEHAGYIGEERLDPKNGIHIPVGAHTLSLSDITPDKETRDQALGEANRKVREIMGKPISQALKNQQVIEAYTNASDQMKERHLAKEGKNPSNLLLMQQAKTKPSWEQYKQFTLAPMLVEDAMGQISTKPITRSYAEGLDVGAYWQQMSGARRGAIMKVQEVQGPGALTKLLNTTTMDTLVTGHDCGAAHGIVLDATDKEAQDRYLAQDFSHKDVHVKAGTLLTPDVLGSIRNASASAKLLVRSPLRCEHEKGVCQKCAGIASDGNPFPIGTNLGVLSAQALGERAVQLTLRHFHSGGVAAGGKNLLGGFPRFEQLATMPEQIPNEAIHATRAGKVEKIEHDPTGVKVWVDGKPHHVGKDPQGNPLWKPIGRPQAGWQPPREGGHVARGDMLSDPARTVVNPHALYEATGSIERVQDKLSEEMHELYRAEGIKRRHVETLVKALTNLTRVKDPGGYEGVLPGELHPQSRIAAINRTLVAAGKQPITHTPELKGVNTLPLSLHEDWMAKLQHRQLSETILDAAARGGVSNIHGTHPVPGMAYGGEFGLTSEHATRYPQHKQLKDVPGYAY
jgi:DNA-directed RNA polymerase subunit beta'